MRKLIFAALVLIIPVGLAAQCTSSLRSEGAYGTAQGASGNARYVVYMPQPDGCFNGRVILFAHGYIAPGSPADTWKSHFILPDGTSLPSYLNSLGFGFAASSFSKDGLAILQGVQDTKALTNVIAGLGITVQNYYVAGVSEGGLIAAKSVENDLTYNGGVAACGPIGSFQRQINYLGDVRVLFDYFFPGVLPGTLLDTAALKAGWTSTYENAIRTAVQSNPLATLQLLSAANIPVGLEFSNAADAVTGALWYNAFATADMISTLGGSAYDNIGRVYKGSFNNARMNSHVARFAAAAPALAALASYETSGLLPNPLVTLHTTADPTVLYEQEPLYKAKASAAYSSRELLQIPVLRYGHCNFNNTEASAALLLMILKAEF